MICIAFANTHLQLSLCCFFFFISFFHAITTISNKDLSTPPNEHDFTEQVNGSLVVIYFTQLLRACLALRLRLRFI